MVISSDGAEGLSSEPGAAALKEAQTAKVRRMSSVEWPNGED